MGAAAPSHVQIGHTQRVVLDELAARLDLVAHEHGENLAGADRILDLHLQQDALGGVGLPVADIPLDDPRRKAGSDRMKSLRCHLR